MLISQSRRLLKAAFFVATVFSLAFHSALALDAVTCVNCANESTQWLNRLAQLKQLANQVDQLTTQIRQYQNMVQNTKGVTSQVWGKAMQDFQKLQALMNKSNSLAYSASNLDGEFSQRYGTYEDYMKSKMNNQDWQNKYNQWSREAKDNSLYAMKTLGLQANQMNNEQAAMQRLQSMAGSAQGRMEALQIANMIAAQNVDQVFKLRQLIMTQTQMAANYLAQQQDKQAASDAAARRFYNSPSLPTKGGKTY